jgi:hypothetical protein
MTQDAAAARLLIHWIKVIYFGWGLQLQMSNAHFIQLVKCNISYKWIQILKEKMSILTHSALLFLPQANVNCKQLGKPLIVGLAWFQIELCIFKKNPYDSIFETRIIKRLSI